MTPDELREQKDIQFYAAGVTAWYNTSLEHDKSLLSLSAAGIGLLLTLLTTVGVGSACILTLYIAAILSFLVSVVSVLVIFARNRTHVEQVLAGTGPKSDRWLEFLDRAAIAAFGLGVLFAVIVAVTAAVNSYVSKEGEKMAGDSKSQSTRSISQESFNNAANLRGADLGRSFNQVGNLQPQPASSAPAPAAQPTAQAPAASSPAQGGSK